MTLKMDSKVHKVRKSADKKLQLQDPHHKQYSCTLVCVSGGGGGGGQLLFE